MLVSVRDVRSWIPLEEHQDRDALSKANVDLVFFDAIKDQIDAERLVGQVGCAPAGKSLCSCFHQAHHTRQHSRRLPPAPVRHRRQSRQKKPDTRSRVAHTGLSFALLCLLAYEFKMTSEELTLLKTFRCLLYGNLLNCLQSRRIIRLTQLICNILGVDNAVVLIKHKDCSLEQIPLFEPHTIVQAELLTALG